MRISALLVLAVAAGAAAAPAPAVLSEGERSLLADAGLRVEALESSGWTPQALSSLTKAIALASQVSREQHERFPNRLGDAFEIGTLSNLEEEVKYYWAKLHGRKYVFRRGCVAHQTAVFSKIFYASPQLPGLGFLRVGAGWKLEHHAVVLFPEGGDWERSGVIIDPWKNQTAQASRIVFTVEAWKAAFWHILRLGPLRVERSEFVAPDPFKL